MVLKHKIMRKVERLINRPKTSLHCIKCLRCDYDCQINSECCNGYFELENKEL